MEWKQYSRTLWEWMQSNPSWPKGTETMGQKAVKTDRSQSVLQPPGLGGLHIPCPGMLERCHGGDALSREVVPIPRASPCAATSLSTISTFFCPGAECTELPAEGGDLGPGREAGVGGQQDPAHRAKQESRPSKINPLWEKHQCLFSGVIMRKVASYSWIKYC